jgi:phosphotransferase system HPr-like phosphotransfer protein
MFLPYTTNTTDIAAALINKTVRYFAEETSVTNDGVRLFKVQSIEKIATAATTGKRYITVKAYDVDRKKETYRTLHLAGIAEVF